MKTISEQLKEGKLDVPVHFNSETLLAMQSHGVNLDCRNIDVMRAIIRPEFLECLVEKKGESVKSLCESLGIKTTAELKALLKGLVK